MHSDDDHPSVVMRSRAPRSSVIPAGSVVSAGHFSPVKASSTPEPVNLFLNGINQTHYHVVVADGFSSTGHGYACRAPGFRAGNCGAPGIAGVGFRRALMSRVEQQRRTGTQGRAHDGADVIKTLGKRSHPIDTLVAKKYLVALISTTAGTIS